MLSHVHKVTGISAEISQNRFDTDVIGVMRSRGENCNWVS